MKKLNSLVFYALVTPAIALGTGSVLAQQTTDQTRTQNSQRTMQSDADRKNTGHTNQKQNYLSSVPANGAHASNLIGAEVKTANNEDIGEVGDLIIGSNGQVLAIVVSVGGFLGMGEKDVAISWDHVTRSGAADDQQLRVKATREELKAAPNFERMD